MVELLPHAANVRFSIIIVATFSSLGASEVVEASILSAVAENTWSAVTPEESAHILGNPKSIMHKLLIIIIPP